MKSSLVYVMRFKNLTLIIDAVPVEFFKKKKWKKKRNVDFILVNNRLQWNIFVHSTLDLFSNPVMSFAF